ncbi:MAG TPA: RDD family protein [Bryobacteraceae bacterium]|nr:RDD family protein [Bryobacteraceae bacterium]
MPLEYAALPRRGAAFFLDALLLTPAVLLARESVPLAAAAVVLWWAAFEASPWQASPGKRLLGLRTMEASGLRVGFGRALWRSVVKALPLLGLAAWPWAAAALAAISLLSILAGRRRRAVHDLAASTAVIFPPK